MYTDAEIYATVMDALDAALADLTTLTSLSLTFHSMPEVPPSLADLPALAKLDIEQNKIKQLPHSGWPALQELQCDASVLRAALASLPAQPGEPADGQAVGPAGHALWTMQKLTSLDASLYDLPAEERPAAERTIRELLPRLRQLR